MTHTLLGLESYFSGDWLALERAAFDRLPRYLGHERSLDPGAFAPAPRGDLILSKPLEGPVRALKNSCPHRGARLCQKPGRGAIVCPLHQWSYAADGSAVGFQPDRQALEGFEPERFLGLLFDRDPLPLGRPPESVTGAFDFEGYQLGGVSEAVWPINWKTFMEMHLDLEHIGGAHPGLGSLVDCSNYEPDGLAFGEGWAWQRMKAGEDLSKSPSEAYREYGAALARLRGGPPQEGAEWLTLYPWVMLEKNPESLMVGILEPRGPSEVYCRVEFYYTEEALAFEPELPRWHQKAYAETAQEDLELCLALEAGRRFKWEEGGRDDGHLNPLTEACLPLLHQWTRERVEQERERRARGGSGASAERA